MKIASRSLPQCDGAAPDHDLVVANRLYRDLPLLVYRLDQLGLVASLNDIGQAPIGVGDAQ